MKSIKWRLATIYVILVIIVMLISGSFIVWLTSVNEYKNIRKELEPFADQVHKLIVESDTQNMAGTTINQEVVERYGNFMADKLLYILDDTGKVLYPEDQMGKSFHYPQVMGALYGNKTDELDRVTINNQEYVGYAKAIYVEDEVQNVIYVLASTYSVNTTLQNIVVIIVMSILIAIVMAAVLGFIFSNFLTKPISILSEKARSMAAGNLDLSIDAVSDDEIGDLTQNFNTMAASLKDTLDQITAEKNKLEIVFSHMTDGILVFDRVGSLIHYNPKSVEMMNITKQKTYEDVFIPYTSESFEDALNRADGTAYNIIKVKDRYYSTGFAKFLGQNDTVAGVICVIQDITEHKKLEDIQKDFVANVSHELRTPITTIKSYTETLLEGALYETEVAEKFLQVINNEGDRMTTLVQDLLDLSKLDNKQTKFDMREVNLNQLLEDSINKYMIHINKKGQTLTLTQGDESYNVIGDANRIEQVFKNIISNASKYSPENSKIEVRLYRKNPYIVVEVEDSGIGIPQEDLPRLFERFYRVDKARSREMGGTGLGLSIAKEIMEHHGGYIDVKSESGKGSTFTMYFPMQHRKIS